MKQYQFPVHAMGYNWLGSNVQSAGMLQARIEKIVKDYKNKGMKCHKVILVTHSMGGLVARYYSECMGGSQNVYGIVHGVMPSTGAAATYTRMKRGTENPESSIEGFITSHVLGRNAAEMTAICSQSPGPLELLPAPDYGSSWLSVSGRNGEKIYLPGNDPYTNLYLKRNEWWKLIDENLLDPYNVTMNKERIESDWLIYKLLIKDIQKLHANLSGKYHSLTYSFYGKVKGEVIPPTFLTQEKVLWKGEIAIGESSVVNNNNIFNDGRLDYRQIMEKRTVRDDLSEEEKNGKFLQKVVGH
jgi:PGAP1-like protein.